MAQRTVTIASSVGLHARPAALFVRAAGVTGLDVAIGRPGEDAVDATSILAVMALGAGHGEEVVLTAEDPEGGRQAKPLMRGFAPRVGIEPTSLILIQSQAGPASRPTGERPGAVAPGRRQG